MSLPSEAREGLMRAWIAILSEKHPELTWIAVEQKGLERKSPAIVGDLSLRTEKLVAEGEVLAEAA